MRLLYVRCLFSSSVKCETVFNERARILRSEFVIPQREYGKSRKFRISFSRPFFSSPIWPRSLNSSDHPKKPFADRYFREKPEKITPGTRAITPEKFQFMTEGAYRRLFRCRNGSRPRREPVQR